MTRTFLRTATALLLLGSLPTGAQVAHTFRIDEASGNASYTSIDLSTFEITTRPSTGQVLTAIADHPDGTLYAAGPTGLWTLDPTTGHASLVGPFGTIVEEVHGMTWDPEGARWILRVVDAYYPIIPYYGSSFLAVDASTGSATVLDSEVGGILWRFAHEGHRILGWTSRDLYELFPETGDAAAISSNLDSIQPSGFDFDEEGTLWMLATPIAPILPPACPDQAIFVVDPADGSTEVAAGSPLLSCHLVGLAVTGPSTVVEVPTLGQAPVAAFAVVLIAASLRKILRIRDAHRNDAESSAT